MKFIKTPKKHGSKRLKSEAFLVKSDISLNQVALQLISCNDITSPLCS